MIDINKIPFSKTHLNAQSLKYLTFLRIIFILLFIVFDIIFFCFFVVLWKNVCVIIKFAVVGRAQCRAVQCGSVFYYIYLKSSREQWKISYVNEYLPRSMPSNRRCTKDAGRWLQNGRVTSQIKIEAGRICMQYTSICQESVGCVTSVTLVSGCRILVVLRLAAIDTN